MLAHNRSLKSKEPRLRDWNFPVASRTRTPRLAWNQKNLDYEIETTLLKYALSSRLPHLKSKEPRLRDWNKLSCHKFEANAVCLKSKEPRLRDWNLAVRMIPVFKEILEIKRTSITRLKLLANLFNLNLDVTWNQKNLDYEIETLTKQ